VLYENVPGILNTKDNAFGAFLGGLCGGDAALDAPINGWPSAGVVAGPARTVAWRVLDAQYFGVAQRRRRVFVLALAGAGGWRCADALLPVTDSLSRHPAPSRGAREGVAGTLAARTHGGGGLGTDFDLDGGVVPLAFGGNKTSGPIDLSTALRAKGGSGHNDFDSETFVLDDLITFDTTQISSPTNRSNPQPGDPCHTLSKDAHAPLIAFDCKASGRSGFGIGEIAGTQRAMGHANSHSNGGGHQAVAYSTKMHNTKSNNAGKIFEERTTALDANSPAPALLTHMSARRLTPRECERLMGLPDNYTLIPLAQMKPSDAMRFASDGPRYKSIGNSWAVPCVSWIGERIVEVDASRTRGGK
jgi:DNA (cytosine-5)-methyltransferase 1